MAALTEAQIVGFRSILYSVAVKATQQSRRFKAGATNSAIAKRSALATGETIRDYLLSEFPGDAIFAEEKELRREGTSGRFWIINPLDGSHNFAKGSPEWSISVALYEEGGAALFGCVNFPEQELMLLAGRNIAAECNGVQMAMIEDAGERLVVGRKNNATVPFHRFHQIGVQMTQRSLIEYTCTTSALLALARNEINGYYCTLEYRWTALTMFPIIEALRGKGKFDFASTENDQPFAFACGNHAFILYVESLFGADTGSTIA